MNVESFPPVCEQVLGLAMLNYWYIESHFFNMSHVKALNSDILNQNNDRHRKESSY